jgi:hypothetical protein
MPVQTTLTLLCLVLCLGTPGRSQGQNVLKFFELYDIGAVPGEIVLSPDYQTVIEFEGLTVSTVSSGRADQITVEIDGQIIRLRANQDVVNTDLTVKAGGETALFVLSSDPHAAAPRRYVVRNSPPPLASITYKGVGGAVDPATLAVGTPALPPGASLDLKATQNSRGDVAVQYELSNNADIPLVNEPTRLYILHGGTKVPYTLSRVPPAGSVNVLRKGQSEYGTVVVPSPPNTELTFLWVLVQLGPGGHYAVERDIERLLTVSDQERDFAGLQPSSGPATTPSQAPATQSPPEASETPVTPPTEPASAPDLPPSQQPSALNLIQTPDFKGGTGPWAWYFYANPERGALAEGKVVEGRFCVAVEASGSTVFGIGLVQENLRLQEGQAYTLRFEAQADQATGMGVLLEEEQGGPLDAKLLYTEAKVDASLQTFTYEVVATKTTAVGKLIFWFGDSYTPRPATVCLDTVTLLPADSQAAEPTSPNTSQLAQGVSGDNLLQNPDFDSEADPWGLVIKPEEQAAATGLVRGGSYCVFVEKGGQYPKSIFLVQRNLKLTKGQSYTLHFEATSDVPTSVGTVVEESLAPHDAFFQTDTKLETTQQTFDYPFVASATTTSARLVFKFGGRYSPRPVKICARVARTAAHPNPG